MTTAVELQQIWPNKPSSDDAMSGMWLLGTTPTYSCSILRKGGKQVRVVRYANAFQSVRKSLQKIACPKSEAAEAMTVERTAGRNHHT